MTNYGPVFILLAAFLWSTDALFRQPLTAHVSSTAIVFLEHLFGLGILLPLLASRFRELRNLGRKDWLAVIVVGVGGSAIATVLFTSAFQYVGPSVAILLQKIQPLIAILLAVSLLGEKLRPRFWAWAVVAMAAAYVISFPNLKFTWSLYDNGTRGVLFALGAAILWGASTVFGRQAIQKVSYSTMSALRFSIAVITLAVIMITQGHLGTIANISQKSFLGLIGIVIVSGTTPILLYYRGLKTTRASVSTIVELVFPLSAVVLNWIFLGDTLVWQQIVAGLVLVFAILKVQTFNPQSQPSVESGLAPAPTPSVE
ncbi:MAG: EamA family transporter [Candidatus Kerfeldbacteria bacterium]|nr:EamA family transporter [Candidatus Kerfeldbacteria bacterium]